MAEFWYRLVNPRKRHCLAKLTLYVRICHVCDGLYASWRVMATLRYRIKTLDRKPRPRSQSYIGPTVVGPDHSPMSMISCRTYMYKSMYNNNSILFLKMHGCNELIGGGIWYMHKLIIASSTTPQISATLHKLLPVHPTGHMLCVHIFDVTQVVIKQLTVYGANHIHLQYLVTCKHYLIHVMFMHKVYHAHNYIIIIHIWYPKR